VSVRWGAGCFVTLAVLVAGAAGGEAADIGWPEAVGRLAGQRSNAELCVAVLKGHGNADQLLRGRLAYGVAKADFDEVIAGLITALDEGATPDSLPTLEAKLEHGASGLGAFCKAVDGLLPPASEQKNVLVDMVKAAVEPVVKSLSEAVATLYANYRHDKAATRLAIRTQLEAAKWPNFDEVNVAQ
jgi:hypothetical protein